MGLVLVIIRFQDQVIRTAQDGRSWARTAVARARVIRAAGTFMVTTVTKGLRNSTVTDSDR